MTTKPNFLFIGADKCGSSWLHEVLSAHPQCYVPPAKDIYFFDRYYEKGLDWYFGFFRAAGQKCVGEICHDYLYSKQVAQRIRRDLPDARLMAFLREPVERTFSHYLYMIRSGRTRLAFRQALDTFPELVEHSLYAKNLAPYLDLFQEDKFRVFFYDDLKTSPRDFAKAVFDFLEIDWMDTFEYEKKVRPASAPRSFLFAKLLKQGAMKARGMGWANLVGRIKTSSYVSRLYKPYAYGNKPVVTEEDKSYLDTVFAEDIARLGELLPGPLPAWARSHGRLPAAAVDS